VSNLRDEQPEPLVIPLSLDGAETLTFDVGGVSGWAAYHSPAVRQADANVKLRFGPESPDRGAPLDLRALQVTASPRDGGGTFNSPLIRTIPFARIIAAINRPEVVERLREYVPPWNLVDDRPPGSAMWAWVLGPREQVRMVRPRLRLDIPGGRRKPDVFYGAVADAYLAQATVSNRAARDLALANDVPVTTVHRWLKEARSRGLLRLPRTTWISSDRGGSDA
jgi:hypothetical protein